MGYRAKLSNLLIVLNTCAGCTRIPTLNDRGEYMKKNESLGWCRANCDIPEKLESMGSDLEGALKEERKAREQRRCGLPEFHLSRGITDKERPDAATSDLVG